jgi:hypothetical protein
VRSFHLSKNARHVYIFLFIFCVSKVYTVFYGILFFFGQALELLLKGTGNSNAFTKDVQFKDMCVEIAMKADQVLTNLSLVSFPVHSMYSK